MINYCTYALYLFFSFSPCYDYLRASSPSHSGENKEKSVAKNKEWRKKIRSKKKVGTKKTTKKGTKLTQKGPKWTQKGPK